MENNGFLKRFRNGERLFGTLITSPSPKFIEIAAELKLDSIFIDLEHFPMDWNQLSWTCSLCTAYNMTAVVRIPEPDPFEACRVLDAGAGGIVAAYIETPDQIQQLRSAVKLRPLKGKLKDKLISSKNILEPEMDFYIRKFNEGKILLVNIESVPAVEALDEILSVPDLDGILIGPHDLSCSLGIPEQYDHPLFEKTVRIITEKARSKKVGVGIHNLPKVEQEIKYANVGINLIYRLADISLFRNALQHDIQKIKIALGENSSSSERKDIII